MIKTLSYSKIPSSETLAQLFLFILLSFVFILPANATTVHSETDLNKAINRAGLQRMLTQRMLKSYCQIGQDQFYAQPDKKLYKALSRFENGLLFLSEFTDIDGLKNSLESIKQLMPQYKTLILAQATKDNIPQLVKMNEKLLALSHQIVLNLEKSSGKELAKIVNVAGRQRMLSQRIELFYLLRDWGFNDDFYRDELAQSRQAFSDGLVYLNRYKQNTTEVKGLLEKADRSFNLFSHSLDNTHNAFLVSLTVNQLLKYMDTATHLYSKM